ncbi:MAG: D-alanyl-D-alanine carboxypeptidase family protein [Nitrospirota bacterium]
MAAFFLSLVLFQGPAVRAEEITARAAIVIDGVTEKILYAKNPNWKLPPASTTKLVTAMVALDRLHPETIITVSRNAANTPSVSPYIRAGERYTVREMLSLALMRSVNSAAVALAEATAGSEAAFVALMNEKAAQMGAENTRFANASGLPGPNQYITAFDLAKVMKEALSYPLIKEILNTRTKEVSSLDGRRLFVKNTNQLLWTDDEFIGGKTGYTRAARHCFVSAASRDQSTLITAVLGESVRDDLWQDSRMLLVKGYEVLAQQAEPMIYFTSANESPIVLASYTAPSKKKYKSAKLAKKTGVKKTAVKKASVKKAKAKKVKTAVAKKPKKKSSGVNLANEGKKAAEKGVS